MNRSLCKPYRASCLRSLDGSLTRANRSTANSIENQPENQPEKQESAGEKKDSSEELYYQKGSPDPP